MTELDRVGNSDNFNFRGMGGEGSIVSASLREGLAGNATKRWKVCTVMVLPYTIVSIAKIRVLEYQYVL